jgi:ferredoxin
MKIPVVDIGTCTLCMGCVEVCPEVFQQNDAGYIHVIELDVYPEAGVNEAIKYCPKTVSAGKINSRHSST